MKGLCERNGNMQIKIAICDDDINIQFAMEGFLQHIFEEYRIDFEIECFDSGDQLCERYEKGKYYNVPYKVDTTRERDCLKC